jgi:hypothetical protein
MMHIFYTKLKTILTCSFRGEDPMALPNAEKKIVEYLTNIIKIKGI